MSVESGKIVTGRVVRLEDYGAFVELADGETGLVHISEVARDYVDNIHAFLAEGEEVKVKVLEVKSDGKIDLSIKRADPSWQDEPQRPRRQARVDKEFNQRLRKFMHQSDMIQGEVRRRLRSRQ